MKYLLSSVSLFALLILAGAGCNPAERMVERNVERSTGGKVDVDLNTNDNKMTVTDKETGASLTAGESVEFPNDFPSDIPRYPNGAVKMASANLAGQSAYLVQTEDTKDDILRWFGDALASDWSQESSLDVQGMTMRSYTRSEDGSEYRLSISVTADDSDPGVNNINVARVKN